MRAIAEVLVSSSLCLPEDCEKLEIKHPTRNFEVTIRNNADAGPFARDALRVEVLYETESLATARDQALDNVAVVLNALCRASGASFTDMIALRAFDWTPGLAEREARYYATHRATVSAPHLDKDFAQTTERLMLMHDDEVSQSVMRWYRLGRQADNIEEQFMYLWFAVEIAAGALKETGKIGHPCPKCGADLFCQSCQDAPQRRRVETEAIKDLIASVAPENADHDELFKTLSKIRNTIQHGRRLSSIIGTLPCSEEQAVTVLANIAWRAITRLADEDADPTPDDPLTLAHIEDVPNKTMVLSSHIVMGFAQGDADHPDLSNAPDVQISLNINGKAYTFDGLPIES